MKSSTKKGYLLSLVIFICFIAIWQVATYEAAVITEETQLTDTQVEALVAAGLAEEDAQALAEAGLRLCVFFR